MSWSFRPSYKAVDPDTKKEELYELQSSISMLVPCMFTGARVTTMALLRFVPGFLLMLAVTLASMGIWGREYTKQKPMDGDQLSWFMRGENLPALGVLVFYLFSFAAWAECSGTHAPEVEPHPIPRSHLFLWASQTVVFPLANTAMIAYWAWLKDDATYLPVEAGMITTAALLMNIEFVLVGWPMRPEHVVWPMLWLWCYLVFVFAWSGASGEVVYAQMPAEPASLLKIAFVEFVCFVFYECAGVLGRWRNELCFKGAFQVNRGSRVRMLEQLRMEVRLAHDRGDHAAVETYTQKMKEIEVQGA